MIDFIMNSVPLAGGGRGRHNLLSSLPDRCDSFTACSMCRLKHQDIHALQNS